MRSRSFLLALVLAHVLGCSAPRQHVEVVTIPPGATAYRLDAPAGVSPAAAPVALTPSADFLRVAREAIGKTPLDYTAKGERPWRLLVELADHEPRMYEIPGVDLEARIAIALEPVGDLAAEDAVLAAILAEGPLARSELEKRLGAEKRTIERLFEKRLLERIEARPERYDLSIAGLLRLEERWGRDEVRARLIESRRALFRAAESGGRRK
jgi:hypothetical protein